MAIYSFEGKVPQIGKGAYVSETANVIGDVIIGEKCYIGTGAIIRGDYGAVRIGSGTAIEENCVVHAPPDEFCHIGDSVIIGHGAIVHSSQIRDFAGIGMGAVLSIHSEVGAGSLIGEGSVVTWGQKIPPGKIAVGNPAKEIGEVSEEHKKLWTWGNEIYVELCERYHKGLKRL
jgi:carbonic anhydrase/acetyltransferase-like protein (isoleucine patch superfamily)